MLCGLSQSLAQIVFFRLLQGVFGAALVPLSQAIVADAYPREERGKAMAIWGLGVMVALGSYMMTFYSSDVTTLNIMLPAFLRGTGLGLIFVPLSTVAYATLERSRMAEAAGIYSLVRTIGSSIGISIVTTVMAHQAQIIWNELGAHITLSTVLMAPLVLLLRMASRSAQAPSASVE